MLIDVKVFQSAPVVDKRNFDGFMNCEPPGQPTFEEHVRLGPLPGVGHSFPLCGTQISNAVNFLGSISKGDDPNGHFVPFPQRSLVPEEDLSGGHSSFII